VQLELALLQTCELCDIDLGRAKELRIEGRMSPNEVCKRLACALEQGSDVVRKEKEHIHSP
jgi:hypothetical protein